MGKGGDKDATKISAISGTEWDATELAPQDAFIGKLGRVDVQGDEKMPCRAVGRHDTREGERKRARERKPAQHRSVCRKPRPRARWTHLPSKLPGIAKGSVLKEASSY